MRQRRPQGTYVDAFPSVAVLKTRGTIFEKIMIGLTGRASGRPVPGPRQAVGAVQDEVAAQTAAGRVAGDVAGRAAAARRRAAATDRASRCRRQATAAAAAPAAAAQTARLRQRVGQRQLRAQLPADALASRRLRRRERRQRSGRPAQVGFASARHLWLAVSSADSVVSSGTGGRHAGVYTQEEVVLLTRDKLHKLQSLYVEQFKRLHQQLKEARRRYVHAVKKEKEAPYPDTASERRAVAKLRALGRYQRHRGVDALLHHQLQEKRLQVSVEGLLEAKLQLLIDGV